MKKARLFLLFTLIAAFALLLLVGCKKEDKILSVSLKDHDADSVIEIAVGEFDYDDYMVLISYESGNVEEIALAEEMLADEDVFKLYQIGEHDITLSYGNQKYVFKVSVKRATFGDLSFPENNVFTYDGKPHVVEVEGDMPANAVVTYPAGNTFINAGTYDVSAIVSCEGYVTVKLSTTVKIERARYDMSGVSFDAKEVVYNGSSHSVAISGTLPEGVSMPTYTIDGKIASSAIEVGEYTVTATFANTNPNYETIPDMVTTLKITPAEYMVNGVSLVFKNENGTVIDGTSKVYDNSYVIFDLNNSNKLSNKISVSFSVYDENGLQISTSSRNTNIKNVGVYTVKVEFTHADGKNYKPIEPITATFEVLKADYTIGGIHFNSNSFVYDGAEHSLEIYGELPEGVTVSYEYYLDGILLTDGNGAPVGAVTDAGRYTVKAIFAHSDANLNEIPSITAVLQISQAKLDTSTLSFEFIGTSVYDGTEKSVSLVGDLPEGVTVSYEYYLNGVRLTDGNGAPLTAVTEAGEYTVEATLRSANPNYSAHEFLSFSFVIEAADV